MQDTGRLIIQMSLTKECDKSLCTETGKCPKNLISFLKSKIISFNLYLKYTHFDICILIYMYIYDACICLISI